ncbi:lysophospholipid acyltransferase family protein [Fibrivirga algicola]|uniref:Lipid A biosynthesis acyltransferase n=1 Tax=Fibrivirga algicola TaxID=2950420 RepID=A0ABX0QLI2_9BACT|nr:lysophospholipid acyltransferase family protein [Fibrivirga algicola]NID12683.1 lipid A biosynthesis acyltransferase [Fibrivirga algicola]
MIILNLLARLPFFALYWLSDLLYLLTAYIIRYRRHVVLDNLRHAFPDSTDKQIQAMARDFYRNFCDVLVETIKLPRISAEEMAKRVTLVNREMVKQFLDQGQTILGAAGHQCNWEWVPAATIVSGIPVDSVYKPLHNASSERVMQQIRGTFGAHLIPMNRLPREMVARRHLPRIVALVADQMPNIPEAAYWTTFLNRETPFFPGTERLARSQKLPVIYLDLIRNRRGYYTATFSLLATPPYTDLPNGEIIERYRDRLTETILKQPANWLWSHKRWKHQREKYAKINTKLE